MALQDAEEASKRQGQWDTTFDELGLDLATAGALAAAGIYTPRDAEHETLDSLQEIELICVVRAERIMAVINALDSLTYCH
jgi:hypothetical protein